MVCRDNYLPGLFPEACPGSAESFERPVLDWTQAPYNFNNGQRQWFFLFELAGVPEVNEFLRTTSLPAFAWIRSLPRVEQDLTWDFPGGDPPDEYTSSFLVSSVQMLPVGALYFVGGAAAFSTLPALLLAAAALFGLLGVLAALLSDFVMGVFAGGYASDVPETYQDPKRELQPVQLQTDQQMRAIQLARTASARELPDALPGVPRRVRRLFGQAQRALVDMWERRYGRLLREVPP